MRVRFGSGAKTDAVYQKHEFLNVQCILAEAARPPLGGVGGGNANFLSLNIYFTLSFMLARFFWLLQFFVLGVFTEKIAILLENAFFPAFPGFCSEILMKFEHIMRITLKMDVIFEKSISKNGGVRISPTLFAKLAHSPISKSYD